MSRGSYYPLALLVCSLFPLSACRADTYYVLIFGSQSTPRLTRFTHTWATFVRVPGDGAGPLPCPLEAFTISWLPASLRVHPLNPIAEPGVNLDLHSTFRYVLSKGERVSAWGPYLTVADVYDRALRQKAWLESGAEKYKARDPEIGLRSERITNCIHAITDLDVSGRGRFFYWELLHFGENASHYIAHQVVTRFGRTEAVWDRCWLAQQLGLTGYPIIWRPFPEHHLWIRDR